MSAVGIRRVLGQAGDAAGAGLARLRLGLGLRVAAVGGVAVAALAAVAAGGGKPWIVPILLVGAALVAAVRADSHLGLGVLLAFGWYWLAHVESRTSPWTLVACAGLLVFHLGSAAAALGPPEADLPDSLLRTWARRAALLLAGSVALWLTTVGLSGLDAGPNAFLTAAALAAVAAAGWLALVRSRPDAEPPRPADADRPARRPRP